MHSELLITEDGSHTLFVPGIDETYHSAHGAIQESRHVFIGAGLKQCSKNDINVLEIGFGTGLNAFLTMLEAEGSGRRVHYTALEKYPVSADKALQLNYPEEIMPESRNSFGLIHTAPWNDDVIISPLFTLNKVETDFTRFEFAESYDVIYFDAFSPEKQPEMWSGELFRQLYGHCNPEAVLTTYCAKGAVRRDLQAAGFWVERLPGPPGKREMLRATRPV